MRGSRQGKWLRKHTKDPGSPYRSSHRTLVAEICIKKSCAVGRATLPATSTCPSAVFLDSCS